MDLSLFDIENYLEDKGIEYKTGGKNVTSGWIELSCPFCADPSWHLGISQLGLYHCWRCGEKGTIVKFVMKTEGLNYHQSIKELSKYYLSDLKELKQEIRKKYNDNIMPKESSKDFPQLHLDYLTSRNFPHSIIKEYDLRACFNVGKYKFRIICPVIEEGRIVSFTALSVSGGKPKYIHCNNEEGLIPIKECLYNIDSVKDFAIIVEGVTDVWRLGDGAVATFGLEYTEAQIALLAKREVKKVVVMFDSEDFAKKKANQLGNKLISLFDSVEVIELEQGDPADLSEEEIKKIKNNIF